MKVAPFRAAGPEPSGVIFFIKKQNLNQENKVIKFLLRTAGPTKTGSAGLAGCSDPQPLFRKTREPQTQTGSGWFSPNVRVGLGSPCTAAETARRSAGWAVGVLGEPIRRHPWAQPWPGETGVCLRKMGSWHTAHSRLWGFSRPAWAAAPHPRARTFKQGLLMGAGEGVGKAWRDAWQVGAGLPQAGRGPGSAEPARV